MAILANQNWNIFASSILIAICKRFGSSTFFVSPGYRDAPFIAALQLQRDVELVSCWDERAAAFQALGWAKASKRPAVLICTSGTAGANYLPAVIEARTDHIPLLIITADRPFELVFASAQQVIDQRDLFGKFVKKSLDFPAPSSEMNGNAWMSYVLMLLQLSVEDRAGPVHLNLPFHAPLDPVVQGQGPSAEQLKSMESAIEHLHVEAVNHGANLWPAGLSEQFVEDCTRAERGLLLIGRLQTNAEKASARALRDRLGWPLFADIGSGLKFESELELPDPNIPQSRAWLERYKPDCVVHLGKRLVTRHFEDCLARWNISSYWVLSQEEHIQDPNHLPQRRQHRPDFSQILSLQAPLPRQAVWAKQTRTLRNSLAQAGSPSFNFRDVAETILGFSRRGLFLGNSTAIRAFDSWCLGTQGLGVEVMANRGVSGIEGLLATTIGLALATKKLWTLVVGDIAMLHDLNSIISLAQSQAQVVVVLVNNSGGRIFETLPVQKYPWVKDPLISTPHSFNFAGVSEMAGIPYHACESRDSFAQIYPKMLKLGQSCIIECKQDAEADLFFTRALSDQEIHYE